MLQSESIRRLVRFGLVGVIVMFCFMLLNWLFGRIWSPQAAFFAAYPPALVLHFLLNKKWTFRDRRATSGRHVAEYLYTVVVTFLIQWPVFVLCLHVLGWKAWFAAGVANIAQMTASFLFLQLRVFRQGVAAVAQDTTSAAWQRLGCLLTVVAVSVLLAWTALGKGEFPPLGPDHDDHYNLLVHGFHKGSLAMDVTVPDDLKQLANPWDPAGRPAGLRVLSDTSYYNGKYYLYFGVVPAVTLMWPFRALTGMDLPMVYALITFCLGAFWVLAWLWLRLLRDHFPQASLLTKVGGILVLGLAGGLLMLARRAHFWELPIAAGQFYLAASVSATYLALQARRSAGWLAAAGLFLGLAVGSRPTLVVAGGGLACMVIALGWRSYATDGVRGAFRRAGAVALMAGAPLALVVAALLSYNYARFGQLTEFGLNYQLTSRYEAKAVHFDLGFARFNWEMYFWRMPQWDRYFPFVRQAGAPAQPLNYYTCEYVFGALTLSPVLWLTLALPSWLLAAWRRRPAGDGGGLMAFGAGLATIAIGTTAILLCFNTAVARYTADFLPWWLLLGLLGWATAEWWLRSWRWGRWLARGLMGTLMLASAVLAFCASVRLHGVLRYRNPDAYVALAQVFNTPVAWWEEWRGEPQGPLEMDMLIPAHPPAVREPLVVAGTHPGEIQTLFVQYVRPGFMQLGFESPEKTEPRLSPAIPVEPGHLYHLRLESGSLYPPAGHPWLQSWSPREIAWHAQWLRVELDGRVIFDDYQVPVEISPAEVQIGHDQREGREPRFTGTLSQVHRTGLPRTLTDTRGGGDVVLHLSFPRAELPPASPMKELVLEQGRPQPLVTAGRPGQADLLALRLNNDRQTFTLLHESWGSGIVESRPMTLPEDRTGLFRIRLGSLLEFPQGTPLDILRDNLVVWLNDRPVWWQHVPVTLAAHPPITVAGNPIGSNAATPEFRGRVNTWTRLPAPAAWQKGPFAGLRIKMLDRGTGMEPVLATGVAGAADTLAIDWRGEGKARLIYDHWGYGSRESPEFAWVAGGVHALEVEWPALARLDAAKNPPIQQGRLHVRLDGRDLWDETVPFYVADSSTVVVGKNPAGSSVAGQTLSSIILDLEQWHQPENISLPAKPASP